MFKTTKKILCLLLAMSLLLTTALPVVAAESTNLINVDVSDITLTKSEEAQEVEILFYIKENVEIGSYCVYIEPEDSNGAIILGTPVQKDEIQNFDYVPDDLMIEACNDDEGTYAPYDPAIKGYVLFGVPVTVAANTEGTYDIVFRVDYVADYTTETEYSVADTVTATISVEEPSAPPADYEISYVLSGTTFDGTGDTDEYVDYNANDKVTATVSLANNTDDDTYLQAYDIYLQYDAKLTIDSTTIKGAVFNTTADGMTTTHIQAVGEDGQGVILDKVAFNAGESIELGTITFSINADAAAYDTAMPITLIVKAADAAGSKEVTNFSIGDAVEGETANGEGDSVSYYPADITEPDGIEVMTQHEVSFVTNGGSEVEEQTVGHNLTATKPEDPTKPNHTFAGWYADEELTNEFVFDTKITDDTTVYAKWEQDTVTVTWYDANGDELTTTTVNKGEKAEYPGKDPSKTAEGSTLR